jgi:hypothetical protein
VVGFYPEAAQKKFHEIRHAIYTIAQSKPKIGPITETLKWGEPAYLTEFSKSGSTIQIDWKQNEPDLIGIYLNSQTSMVETMRLNHPGAFSYRGNRCIQSRLDVQLPMPALKFCLYMALTYHSSKNQ